MFYLLIYRPLFNILSLLIFIFKGNLGLAILVLAILLRFCMFPLNRNLMKNQQKMTKIQPQLKELQEKYKSDPQKMLEEMQKLYKLEGIKFSSMFNGMLLQFVLLILFFIFIRKAILTPDWTIYLYNFIHIPLNINFNFLGLLNLKEPNLYLLIFYFILTLIPTFIQLKSSKQNAASLLIFLGIIFGLFLLRWQDFNAAIIFSWIGMALVSILEAFLNKPASEVLKKQ